MDTVKYDTFYADVTDISSSLCGCWTTRMELSI